MFMNDLPSCLERMFSFVDISRSKDPKKEFLPYLTGFDRHRHKNHGRLNIEVSKCLFEIYPRRRINKFTDKLEVECFDLQYGQKNLNQKESSARLGCPVLL